MAKMQIQTQQITFPIGIGELQKKLADVGADYQRKYPTAKAYGPLSFLGIGQHRHQAAASALETIGKTPCNSVPEVLNLLVQDFFNCKELQYGELVNDVLQVLRETRLQIDETETNIFKVVSDTMSIDELFGNRERDPQCFGQHLAVAVKRISPQLRGDSSSLTFAL